MDLCDSPVDKRHFAQARRCSLCLDAAARLLTRGPVLAVIVVVRPRTSGQIEVEEIGTDEDQADRPGS
jgi:hypothetical protein